MKCWQCSPFVLKCFLALFSGTAQAVDRAGQTAERVFSNPAGTEQSKEAAQKLSNANSEIPRALAGGAQKVLPFSSGFLSLVWGQFWRPGNPNLAASEVLLHSGFTVNVSAVLRLLQVQSRSKK